MSTALSFPVERRGLSAAHEKLRTIHQSGSEFENDGWKKSDRLGITINQVSRAVVEDMVPGLSFDFRLITLRRTSRS